MKYQMTTIKNGTRLRKDHNTFASVVESVNAGTVVQGDEMWESPTDGAEVKKGDKWMLVSFVGGIQLSEPSWMAFIHKGQYICDNFREVSDSGQRFPDSFVLEHPDGTRAEFEFVRVIE